MIPRSGISAHKAVAGSKDGVANKDCQNSLHLVIFFLHQHQVAQLKKSRFPMAISVEQSKPDPCHCNFLCTFSPFSLGLGQHWQTEWAAAGQWINVKID